MAEQAFALSPISARAAQPGEEDYAAISEAFMETARGRWFLGEYAKRNRNADTRMVLDAVARIEQSLAAQRQAAADAFRDEQLEQALTALRGAVEAAQASAIAALDDLGFEQLLVPVRKGVRVIREISWRLREIGNDGRICDIIDSQASAIEAGAAQVSMDDAKAVLDTAFATLARRLAEFRADEAIAPATEAAMTETEVAEAPIAPPSPPAAAESAVNDVAAAATVSLPEAAMVPVAEVPAVTTPQPDETEFAEAEPALAEADAPVIEDAEADAHDEAMLDLIAMEMGAPDPIDDDEALMVAETHIPEALPVEPEKAAQELARAPEPIATPPVPMVEAPAAEVAPYQPAPQADIAPAPEPAVEMSLGSTIIASGLVKKPSAAANDPLAPIRRMSQAEKIAFFS